MRERETSSELIHCISKSINRFNVQVVCRLVLEGWLGGRGSKKIIRPLHEGSAKINQHITSTRTSGCINEISANTTLAFCPPKSGIANIYSFK